MLEELRSRGLKCNLVFGYSKRTYLKFLLKLPFYNVIYFQKRYLPIDLKLCKIALLLGKKIVFDIDDAPFGTAFNHLATKQASRMMELSSAIVVGSNELKKFAQAYNRNVYFLPSFVNLNHYKSNYKLRKLEDSNSITLGWIGNGKVYKKDLLILLKPLEDLGKTYNIKLILVGALGQKDIYRNFHNIKNIKIEIIDSIDWAKPNAAPLSISNFDIGLYPLIDNEYNKYKCGYKALEYMAMKIPVVASPIGENKTIIKNGKDGFLAVNENEWKEYISYLIKNKEFRERMGENGRKKVEEYYSLEICANKLLDIL